MNLLFSINKEYMSLLLTCMQSIDKRGGAARYEAYILNSDLSTKDQTRILMFAPSSFKCHFIHVHEELFEGFPESKRYPKQIYYRLAAAHLLPETLNRILYLDVDTIIINSLMELYTAPFENNLFMACTHTDTILTRMNQLRLKTKKNVPYINTGVMLMNLSEMRNSIRIETVRNYAIQNKSLLILPDQDILTALYGNRVKLVDTLKYNLSDQEIMINNADITKQKIDLTWVRKNTVIIHYYGSNRPWKPNYKGILGAFYAEAAKPMYDFNPSPYKKLKELQP